MSISPVASRHALMDRMVDADVASIRLMEGGIEVEILLAQDQSAQMKELHASFLENRTKLLDQMRRSQKWSWAHRMVGFLQSIASVFIGAASGNVVLVVTGVVGITHQAMKASGGWEKLAERLSHGDTDRRDSIMLRIDMGTTYGLMAISFASAASITWTQAGQGMRNAINATQDVTAAATAITTIGRGQTTARRMQHEARCTEIGWEIRLGEMLQTEGRAKLTSMLESLDGMLRMGADGIDGYQRLTHNLTKV
jgi:hypothetical protein